MITYVKSIHQLSRSFAKKKKKEKDILTKEVGNLLA